MSSSEQTSAAEALSEMTGRPAEDFEAPEAEYPHPDDLESVDHD